MGKPLQIPKTRKVPGLFTFCSKCKKRTANGKCGQSKEPITKCKNKEKHHFKVSFKIPNTNSVRTKNLETKDLNEATKQAYAFKEELEQNNYNIPEDESDEEIKYFVLSDAMKMYLDYLNNIGVPEHRKKERTKAYIDEVTRYLNNFLRLLKKLNYSLELFRVDQVSETILGEYHNYLFDKKKYSNRTYNKHIAALRQFYNWLIEQKEYEIKNPFNGVISQPVLQRNETITKDEFERLLSVVTKENSRDKRVKYYKYYFKPWLKSAFKLALYTGLRREELFNLKWEEIEYDKDGEPILVKVPNLKVIRLLKGRRIEGARIKWVPVIPELKKVLQEDLNFESNRNMEGYLFAENENVKRDDLPLFLSRAFNHFWNLTGIKRKVQLNDLRNTYITELYKAFGDKAAVISDHSNIETVKKHYMKSKLVAEAANKFRVFE